MVSLLNAIVVILVILWAIGFLAVHVGGSLIHTLLVVALVLFIFNLVTGRRAV